MTEEAKKVYAIVEIMGHTVVAGALSEESKAGVMMLRVDVPPRSDDPDSGFTRFYSGGSLFGITPCSAEDVQRWIDYRRPGRLPVYLPQDSLLVEVEAVGQLEAGAQRCRVCGCTDEDCSDCVEATGTPCHWIPELANDDGPICSRCAPVEVPF